MPVDDKILIPKPDAGASLDFKMCPGQVYQLGFSPGTAIFELIGPDVRIDFDNGARILLHDFSPVAKQHDFFLELGDGTVISARDLAEVLAMNLKDFHTDGHAGAGEGGIVPFDCEAGLFDPFDPSSEFRISADSEALDPGFARANPAVAQAGLEPGRALSFKELLDSPAGELFVERPGQGAACGFVPEPAEPGQAPAHSSGACGQCIVSQQTDTAGHSDSCDSLLLTLLQMGL